MGELGDLTAEDLYRGSQLNRSPVDHPTKYGRIAGLTTMSIIRSHDERSIERIREQLCNIVTQLQLPLPDTDKSNEYEGVL